MTIQSIGRLAPLALTLTVLACSRDTAPPGDQTMTPASGSGTPRITAAMPHCAENFRAFDADGNSKVSEQEFFARPHANPNAEALFRARDSDGDKALTEAEFCSGWRGDDPGMMGGSGRMGRGMGPRPGGPSDEPYCRMGGPMRGTNCDTHFDAFDADGDGKLTRDEFAACPQARGDAEARFSERDHDQDGNVTRDEFCAPWR